MPSVNQLTIVGHIVRDPEMRYTQTGKAVCQFSIAASRKLGEKESTTFFDCKAWGGTAEAAAKDLRKGDAAIGIGRVETEVWDDKQTGQKRSKQVLVCDVVGRALYEKKDAAVPTREAAAAHTAVPRPTSRPTGSDAGGPDDVPF